MEDLTSLGLAIKTSTYTSRGIYVHQEYRTPFYVIKKITALIKTEYPGETINNLYKVYIVQMAVIDHNYMYKLKQLLRNSSFRAELQAFFDILYSKGATTRLNTLNINTDVTTLLFIVVDKSKFEEQLINTVEQILRSLVVK